VKRWTIDWQGEYWTPASGNSIIKSFCADITFINTGDTDVTINGILLQTGAVVAGRQLVGGSYTHPAFGNELNETQYQVQLLPFVSGSGVGPQVYVFRKHYKELVDI
jgi:hypothetical protein